MPFKASMVWRYDGMEVGKGESLLIEVEMTSLLFRCAEWGSERAARNKATGNRAFTDRLEPRLDAHFASVT